MIEEAYVSFETAKLLKEKGFDVKTEHKMWYVVKQFSTGCHWNSCTYKVGDITREYNDDCCISMPTQQIVMRWLREVHNIFIVIEPHMYDYINEKNSSYVASLWQGDNYYENITSKDYPTYEEAVEEAIKYSLKNLI